MNKITSVEYLTEPDSLGRVKFFINWMDGKRERSQIFFANPKEYGLNYKRSIKWELIQ